VSRGRKINTCSDLNGGHDTSSVQDDGSRSKLISACQLSVILGMDEGSCTNLVAEDPPDVVDHCIVRGRVIKAPSRFQDFILE
jgi:hypothetical protein